MIVSSPGRLQPSSDTLCATSASSDSLPCAAKLPMPGPVRGAVATRAMVPLRGARQRAAACPSVAFSANLFSLSLAIKPSGSIHCFKSKQPSFRDLVTAPCVANTDGKIV